MLEQAFFNRLWINPANGANYRGAARIEASSRSEEKRKTLACKLRCRSGRHAPPRPQSNRWLKNFGSLTAGQTFALSGLLYNRCELEVRADDLVALPSCRSI
jgi:hypothetical protein